jgi:hypothetical protein
MFEWTDFFWRILLSYALPLVLIVIVLCYPFTWFVDSVLRGFGQGVGSFIAKEIKEKKREER